MRFNYFKELISSALLYALCVKGCKETKFFASKCVPNANGQIIELELKNNAVVDAKYFSTLTSIEKLTISGEQKYIQQSHFNEIATRTTLKEIHLTYTSVSINKIDMTVLKKNKNLSYLEVSDSCAKRIRFAEMNYVKELFISNVNLTQNMVNDMAKISNLKKVSFIKCNFNNAGISAFNNAKKLDTFELKDARNVNGQTLTNASLKKAEYHFSSNGKNNFCMNNKSKIISDKSRKSLKPCSGSVSTASFSSTSIKISNIGKCGAKHGKCPNGQCCSKNGQCGTGTKFCGKNCLFGYGKCNYH